MTLVIVPKSSSFPLRELKTAVKTYQKDRTRVPLIHITKPTVVKELPPVNTRGSSSSPAHASGVILDDAPKLPGLSSLIDQANIVLADPNSVPSLTMQAAAAVNPSYTFLILPIMMRESSLNPKAMATSTSATGLMQLINDSAVSASERYAASAFLQSKLMPLREMLPGFVSHSTPLVRSGSGWRSSVLTDPYIQVIPNAVWYHAVLADMFGRKPLVFKTGDEVQFNLPSRAINPVLERYPALRSNLQLAQQFVASMWWIEGGPTLISGLWKHVSHAMKDVSTLNQFKYKSP